MRFINKIRWVNIAGLGAAVLFCVGLVCIYVSQERAFYFWDYSAYQDYAIRVANDLFSAPLLALLRVWVSTSHDYNDYFALPLSPFVYWFKGVRWSYILGIGLLYQLPYALTLGAIAQRLFQANPGKVFWLTTFIALFTPMAWAPALRGYPDVAAAWMVALAILVYAGDAGLQRWQTPVWIGVCLAAAALLRRHFSYDGVAFYFVFVVQVILAAVRQKWQDGLASSNHHIARAGDSWRARIARLWLSVKSDSKAIALSGVVYLATLALFGAPFLVKVLITPYGQLYASYSLSPVVALEAYLAYYGWLVWGLAVAGYALAAWRGLFNPRAAFFVWGIGLTNLVLWVLLIRNAATHYTLHLSTFVILGVSAWFWSVLRGVRKSMRVILAGFSGAFLAINLVLALAPLQILPAFQPLFSKVYPPLFRQDYDEVERLVRYLRSEAHSAPQPIYVVDSSALMNFSLLRHAEKMIFVEPKLNILAVPEIDSRDVYPLEALMQAEYVIVSQPIQLPPTIAGQKIPRWVYDTFVLQQSIAQDFRRLPDNFHLENDAVLSIYRRIQPTPVKTAVQSFDQMADFIGQRPGKQPDWVLLRGGEHVRVSTTASAFYRIQMGALNADIQDIEVTILFIEKNYGGQQVWGTWAIQGACSTWLLRFDWIAPDGLILQSQEAYWDNARPTDFTAGFSGLTDHYLVVTLKPVGFLALSANCRVGVLLALE